MRAYYKVTVTKQPIGTAILHQEPPLQGEVIIKVTDTTTAGDFKLIVLDCTEAEHAQNLALPGVTPVAEQEAEALAPRYQPARTLVEHDERTGKEEKRAIPPLDLKPFLAKRDVTG